MKKKKVIKKKSNKTVYSKQHDVHIAIRMPKSLKERAQEIFKSYNYTQSQAIRDFYRAVCLNHEKHNKSYNKEKGRAFFESIGKWIKNGWENNN